MVPVAGLLLIQPLSGGGRAPASDLVQKEEDILPWLGRADLLKAIVPPGGDAVVPVDGKSEAVIGDENAKPLRLGDIEEEGTADGGEVVAPSDGAAEERGAGMLPKTSAGDGPGSVEGVVSDEQGKGVPGVIITLPDQGVQMRTADDGSFRITGLPVVGVTAQFIKPAYLSKVDVFQIREEGVTKVTIRLELKPVELADGEYLLDAAEIILDPVEERQQGAGISVATAPGLAGGGLSRDIIDKTASVDASDAIGKISGANVVGGSFVVVRGLGDRYNNTTLNGGIVPSPVTSRRAVQLDLFPSSALENIAIKKSADPRLPADFVGGLVQLQTLSQSEEDFFNIRFRTFFDVTTHREGDFLTVPGLEASSDLRPSNFIPIPTTTTTDSGALARQEREAFFRATSFGTRRSSPELDQDFAATFSKSWELSGNSKFTLIGSLGRQTEQRYEQFEQSRFGPALDLGSRSASSILPSRGDLSTLRAVNGGQVFSGLVGNFVQESYTESENFNALVSGSLEVGKNLSLNGAFFNFRSADATFTRIENGVTNLADFDIDDNAAFAINQVQLDGREVNSFRQIYEQVYRELEFGQLGGEYRFDDWREGAKMTWNAYNGATTEASPRTYELRGFDFPDGDSFSFGGQNFTIAPIRTLVNPANTGNPIQSRVLSFETNDESGQFKVDGVAPFFEPTEERRVDFLGGFGQFQRTRTSSLSAGAILAGQPISSLLGSFNPTRLLLADEEVGRSEDASQARGYIVGTAGFNVTPEYTGSNEISSIYGGIDGEWDSWFWTAGLRYEEETRGFSVPGLGVGGERSSDDLLPSLTFGRDFGSEDAFKFAMSFSETVIRPTFYEFIPARILDLTNQRIIEGNQNLSESSAQNFEANFSWRKDDNFAGINVFYKTIADPIFTIADPSGVADRTFVNLGDTEVFGVELEGSYELGGGFSVTGNMSFIETSAEAATIDINDTLATAQIDRLEGQPNLLGNLIMSWSDDETGWGTNLIYSYTGDYLTVAGLELDGEAGSATPNEIRQPFHSLDWNISKKWSGALADYKLEFIAQNILDSEVEVRFEGLSDTLSPAEALSPGRVYGISFEARF
ncbi:MAG: hypothetical protein ACJAVK_002792 [Akkermansiaceae bacterium]|jgi:hypothetical protein